MNIWMMLNATDLRALARKMQDENCSLLHQPFLRGRKTFTTRSFRIIKVIEREIFLYFH